MKVGRFGLPAPLPVGGRHVPFTGVANYGVLVRAKSSPGSRRTVSGEHAVSARREPAADELLEAQLAKLQRKIDAVAGERRRLADLYQAAFIEREELLRRGNELCNRGQHLQDQRDALIAQRTELAHQSTPRQRIARILGAGWRRR